MSYTRSNGECQVGLGFMDESSGSSLEGLIRDVRGADSGASVYLGVYRANARFAVPESASYVYGFRNDFGRTYTIAETNYEDYGIGRNVPGELCYFSLILCPDGIERAAVLLYEMTSYVHTACMLSANASADVLRETLVTEWPATARRRIYRQFPFDRPSLPQNGRFMDKESTIKLAGAIWGHSDRERIMAAAAHYQEALRHWREGAKPLVILHLYIGVEALSKAMLRWQLTVRNASEAELMEEYGIDGSAADAQEANEQLLRYIRRDFIFQGDGETYDVARRTSNGIEHGYEHFKKIWSVSFDVAVKTARYLRRAIVTLRGIAPNVAAVLNGEKFVDVCEHDPPPSFQAWISPGETLGHRLPCEAAVDLRELEYTPMLSDMVVDDSRGSYQFVYRDALSDSR